MTHTETPEGLDFEITHVGTVEEPAHAQEDAAVEDTPTPENPDTDDTSDDEEDLPKTTRLRKRAQDAERERDLLRDQLATTRRELIEAQATRLYKPAALWANGTDPDSLFTDDGRIDHAALDLAIEDARRNLGVPLRPRPDPNQGPRTYKAEEPTTWADIL